jgi:flagellar biosynthesis protein
MADSTDELSENLDTAIAFHADSRSQPTRERLKANEFVADEILLTARRNGVPLRQDVALVQALSQHDVGSAIPPELFRAVAEVLSFVHRLEHTTK